MMTKSGSVTKPERETQNRVVKLFCEKLGYTYLGDWQERDGNSNVEVALLTAYLREQNYSDEQISKAIHILKTKAAFNTGGSLYHENKDIYKLLYYGATVKVEAGKPNETVQLIDWKNPEANHFAIAEEVTVYGKKEKRPDVVLYVNGIAVGVLELKNSRIDLAEGIRQSIVNQKPEYIRQFFTTVQFIFAGNDSQGLRYGTIGTPEKKYLSWKEDITNQPDYLLDKYLEKMCRKDRLIELMYDFVVFDGGEKKLPRVNQYFGIKAAQEHVRCKEGGIIWHTQGSGKSITMVYLAKWILENNPHARVLVVTDRDELDKQIEEVFIDTGEDIYRTSSGKDLMRKLGEAKPRLVCSLVHKFGRKSEDNFEAFIKELENTPSQVVGELFVFVDECHRTQSGKLNRTMKALMPGAVFVGFTGTPLLKNDKHLSKQVFGNYIHTYKYNEAVEDGVVLDLNIESRDVDQWLSSEEKIDEWLARKTKGLNAYQVARLKKRWGTMQKVLSSKSRTNQIVNDIVYDFCVRPRLSDNKGNAILVASSIFDACRFYEMFQETELKGKCAIITSYDPAAQNMTKEDSGASTVSENQYKHKVYTEILKDVQASPGKSKAEVYEDEAKKIFVNEPWDMKLLIVRDKLLTGFNAPSCTYLYIDKSMEDHGLFQAISRVNRLDGEDKEVGYVVDYKDLFKKVESAISVYTSEIDSEGVEPEENEIEVQRRIEAGKIRLDDSLEKLELLCEPVEQPKGDLEYLRYFCGNTEIAEDLKAREMLRDTLYKSTASFLRSYTAIADGLPEAGYSDSDVDHLSSRLNHYLKLREYIKMASGEHLDLKAYESDMRHLFDTYIKASETESFMPFGEMSLLEVIEKSGIDEAIKRLPEGNKGGQRAVAETIENNVRQSIIKNKLLDPAYFEKMSEMLNALIKKRKQEAIEYIEYLKQVAALVCSVNRKQEDSTPKVLDTPGKRALWNNLDNNEDLAIRVDAAIMDKRGDSWRGNQAKERMIKQAIHIEIQNIEKVEEIFRIVKQQQGY